jgi:NAD(P)-dependent dehydrogenase (short-subunit alcohol dehydrogenase family)
MVRETCSARLSTPENSAPEQFQFAQEASVFPDLFSLAGKIALVTGASRGIGLMIAEGFLRAGAAKVYISSRKADACEAAVRELSAFGDAEALAADISTESECQRLIETISAKEERLHLLVNNAGTSWGAPFSEFPEKGWSKVVDLNLKAPSHLTKFALPLLRAAATDGDPARVINIGSIDGLIVPIFDNFSYSASKAGLHHLTRHMAAALAPEITVNAIAPGPFATALMDLPLKTQGERIRNLSRLKRIGRKEDMVGTAVFLAAKASAFMTGAIVPLDGGIAAAV